MTVKVQSGNEGYTTLYDHWVDEGSPTGIMERTGTYGGELWTIRFVGGASVPTFYLRAAAGPTDPGNDKDIEWDWAAQRSGYLVEMADTGMTMPEPRQEGDLRLGMRDFPLDEDVWSP